MAVISVFSISLEQHIKNIHTGQKDILQRSLFSLINHSIATSRYMCCVMFSLRHACTIILYKGEYCLEREPHGALHQRDRGSQ